MRIRIGGKILGEGEPCFIVAEAGINHNGDINIAKQMIDVAKNCGVDAIKFQTFTARNFVRDEKQQYEYQTQGKRVKESMLKMFERHEFKQEEWAEIASYCKCKEIVFFSTPQDVENLDLLLTIGIPAIKIGSDDLINLPLLEEYSKIGLPIIISTGMAYESEIADAVKTIEENFREIAILHCVSSYPADLRDLNMRKIASLIKEYPDHVIGFSDHSEGTLAATISIALGAKIFEKHFTLDKNMYGPDHRFSADPDELRTLVKEIRKVESALGSPMLEPNTNEKNMRKQCHRSIVAAKDIQKDEVLTEDHLAMKRPGTGLSPKHYFALIGKKAKKQIKKGELLYFEHVKMG